MKLAITYLELEKANFESYLEVEYPSLLFTIKVSLYLPQYPQI
jgi:hypothetical protein